MGEALNSLLQRSEGLGSASFFAFLVAILIILGLWSGSGRSQLLDLFKGPSASRLFLSVPVRLVSGQQGKARSKAAPDAAAAAFTVHVTALNTKRATFISPTQVSRGSKVAMEFKELPDFPIPAGGAGSGFEAVVVSSLTIKGKPDSYQIEAAFGPLDKTLKTPLLSYLKRLTGAAQMAEG